MQKRGKERAAKCKRRPLLKPASVKIGSVPPFQAEEVGEGSSMALPTTLRRMLAAPGRGTVGEQKSLSFTEVIHTPHTASAQVGVVWFFMVAFAFTNANFYA